MKVRLAALALVAASSVWAQGGRVEVSYRLERIGGIASNQVAVWIEDEAGAHVRTLFVTDFTARKSGFKRRPQCLPAWVRTAGVDGWKPAEIDAVSGATQKPGNITLVWDCKDARGRRVSDGVYVYRVEGNLRWENTVLWTGRVRLGAAADSSRALATYSPAGAEQRGVLVADVRASFQP